MSTVHDTKLQVNAASLIFILQPALVQAPNPPFQLDLPVALKDYRNTFYDKGYNNAVNMVYGYWLNC